MNIHKNARLTPLGRERIVRMAAQGVPPGEIALAVGVSLKTVLKWIGRFAAEGVAGLADRSSRPHRLHRPTPEIVVEQVIALRRQKQSGKDIAKQAGVSPATVSRILRRARLSRMRDLEPAEPVRRYERAHPGELIHIDIKKLGRTEARNVARAVFPLAGSWLTSPPSLSSCKVASWRVGRAALAVSTSLTP